MNTTAPATPATIIRRGTGGRPRRSHAIAPTNTAPAIPYANGRPSAQPIDSCQAATIQAQKIHQWLRRRMPRTAKAAASGMPPLEITCRWPSCSSR